MGEHSEGTVGAMRTPMGLVVLHSSSVSFLTVSHISSVSSANCRLFCVCALCRAAGLVTQGALSVKC